MDQVELYVNDFGQQIWARTYLSDIANATAVKIRMKNVATETTTYLDATYQAGEVDEAGNLCYAVRAIVQEDFLDAMAGEWIATVEATYSNGRITSLDPFYVIVKATPTS